MSLASNETFTPKIPTQRPGRVIELPKLSPEQATQDEADTKRQILKALHRALGLTTDQTVVDFHANNTVHTTRDGSIIPGKGEMIVSVTVAGKDIDGTAPRRLEVRDGERADLDEQTITALGAQALRNPRTEWIELV